MPGTRCYVGNLCSSISAEDLRELFRVHGPIDRVDMKKDGFAFVEYMRGTEGEQAVISAMQALDGREVHGVNITVQEAKGPKRDGPKPPMQRSDHRVRVEGMPHNATWQDLKDFARGKIGLAPLYTEVVRPGLGIIEYHRYDDMMEALRIIHNTALRGTIVQVYEDAPPRGGGGGGRPRDHSRSPPRRDHRGRDRDYYVDEPPRGRPRSRSRDRDPRYAHHHPMPPHQPPAYGSRGGRSRSRSPPRRGGYAPTAYADDPYRRPPPPPPASISFYDDYAYGGRGSTRGRSRSPQPRHATGGSYAAPPARSAYPEYSAPPPVPQDPYARGGGGGGGYSSSSTGAGYDDRRGGGGYGGGATGSFAGAEAGRYGAPPPSRYGNERGFPPQAPASQPSYNDPRRDWDRRGPPPPPPGGDNYRYGGCGGGGGGGGGGPSSHYGRGARSPPR